MCFLYFHFCVSRVKKNLLYTLYFSILPKDCCLFWLFILLLSKTSYWMVPVFWVMHDWFHQTFLYLDHWSYLKHPKWPLYRVVLFFSFLDAWWLLLARHFLKLLVLFSRQNRSFGFIQIIWAVRKQVYFWVCERQPGSSVDWICWLYTLGCERYYHPIGLNICNSLMFSIK